jgi:Skp family chaperone for outer membrane proteins
MRHPLRNIVMACAAVLALSAGAAFAADTTTSTTATADGQKVGRHMIVVRDGKTVVDDWSHGDGRGPDMGPGMRAMMMRREHRDPEKMAKPMRVLLQLTPAQEPALQAFLASMKTPHGPEHEGMEMRMKVERGPDGKVDSGKLKTEAEGFRKEMDVHRAEMEKKREAEMAMTTPQRLDAMVKHMAERAAKRQAEMQAHVKAVKTFYAALTPSQQKAFDALHGAGMGGGIRGMHDGGHEHGPRMLRFGMEGPMPPMPPMPPVAMHGPPPPLPPLPPEPPAPPPGDR